MSNRGATMGLTGVRAVAGMVSNSAPLGATVALVLVVAAAVLFTVGWRLAVRRHYDRHHQVQIGAAVLNGAVVAAWMIRSLIVNVIPALPGKLGEGSYTVATVHAAVGLAGVIVGVVVVLGTSEVVPRALRISRFKPIMRASYALYMVATITGVSLYVVTYVHLR